MEQGTLTISLKIGMPIHSSYNGWSLLFAKVCSYACFWKGIIGIVDKKRILLSKKKLTLTEDVYYTVQDIKPHIFKRQDI